MAAAHDDVVNNDLIMQINHDLQHFIQQLDLDNLIALLKKHAQSHPKQLEIAIIRNKMILPCLMEMRSIYFYRDDFFYDLCFPKKDSKKISFGQWLPLEMVRETSELICKEKLFLRLLVENGLYQNIRQNVNIPLPNGNTWLHQAVECEIAPFIIEMLIDCGAVVDVKNSSGESPLYRALQYNKNLSVIFLLLEHSSDPSQWPTPFYAIDHQDVTLLQLLLKKGVDIDARVPFGDTLLHLAIRRNSEESIKFLLKKCVDINRKDSLGEAPLHLAIRSNNERIVKILLEKGADVNMKNSEGESVSDYARKRENPIIITLVQEYIKRQHKNGKLSRSSSPLTPCSFRRPIANIPGFFSKSSIPLRATLSPTDGMRHLASSTSPTRLV